jgi:uncharacterized RDD family membrane protein YckC
LTTVDASGNGVARFAGLPRRCAALAYDVLLLAALFLCLTSILVLVRGLEPIPPGTWWYEASLIAVAGAFFAWYWTHGGQTLGMRAWRIRVVKLDGRPVGSLGAIVRFGAGVLSILPLGLGFWWALVDERRRCWHDLVAGTVVVRVT